MNSRPGTSKNGRPRATKARSRAGTSQLRDREDEEPSQGSRGATWTPLEKTELVKAILPKHKELYGNFKGSTALTAETKDIE
jgi:hypothetical protein